MNFSKILKRERKNKNLTQFELAELLNVSDKTISSWENGRSYPDIIMLKSIASALKIEINVLLDAEDFATDVNDIDKEELEKNHNKEKKYIRNVIISILLNIVSLLIPIVHIILQTVYGVKFNSSISSIPHFKEYEKVSRIVFPILITCCVILMMISVTLFIISTITFKKDLIDTNYNARYKLIMHQYINLYSGILAMVLFLTCTPLYKNEYIAITSFLILLLLYLLSSVIVCKHLGLVQLYNRVTIIEFISLSVLLIVSFIMMFCKAPIVILILLTCIYLNLIILLYNKDLRKDI